MPSGPPGCPRLRPSPSRRSRHARDPAGLGYPRCERTHGITVNPPSPGRGADTRRARATRAPSAVRRPSSPLARAAPRSCRVRLRPPRAARHAALASSGRASVQARRTPAPNSASSTSCASRITRAPPASSALEPAACGAVIRPGTAPTGRPRSRAASRGDERAGVVRGLDHDRHRRQRRDHPVARREHPAPQLRSRRQLGDDRPGRRRSGGAAPASPPGRGARPALAARPPSARRRQRALVGGRVDPQRHPADHRTPPAASARASDRATSSPYGDARRAPTIATG